MQRKLAPAGKVKSICGLDRENFLTVAETSHSLHARYVSYFCHVQSIKTILRTSPVRPLQMYWVGNSCKPVFLSGQTDLLQLYASVMSCSRAKLNLFADKRLCNRDSFKCLSVDL